MTRSPPPPVTANFMTLYLVPVDDEGAEARRTKSR